ncbi:DEAD/DEAH box helicase [Phormidium sp. FACHB-1136]|uniref:DEAD/DEAH box helicase n=1 Tax=Phormidium sp. FACHB-1136 TaxID=2692848 RepID=UPI0016872AD4|nr:DEAD/DEAH box helicase [Phormidium sp. FACHB-1136]MBD2428304.1 DEAD/DEAH box helicase family protein [Phormidium sp. FACHB-1136]
MALYDYQSELCDGIREAIRAGHRQILACLPTGGGKTFVAGDIVAKAVGKGNPTLCLAHRDPLIDQAYRTFTEDFGLRTGIIKAGVKPDPGAPIQIAQVQSLEGKHHSVPPWRLCLIDEAHSTTFFKVVKTLIQANPNGIVIGLTATPFRLGKQYLADHYTVLVQGPSPAQLIQRGRLVPPRYFGYEDLDLSKVTISSRTGDFDTRQLQQAVNSKPLNQKLVREYKKLAGHRKGIVFATGIEDSKAIAETFNEAGIPAAHIDGSMPKTKRKQIYRDHASGQIQVVVNVGTLTEGYDCRSIECVVLRRPSMSRALVIQMMGRGLRISPETGKTDCIIIDFGTGNLQRFGRIEDELKLSLDKPPESKTEVKLVPCPQCRAMVTVFHQTCPECGFKLKPEAPHQPKLLEPIPHEWAAEQLSPEELKQQAYYRRQLALAYRRGYKPGFAVVKFKELYRTYPPAWWSQGAVFGPNPSPEQQAEYLKRMVQLAEQQGLDDAWIERQIQLEFGDGFQVDSIAKAI